MTKLENSAAIDSWIHFLSKKKKIKEFKLEIPENNFRYYKIPSTLFSFQALSSLELCGFACFLYPPRIFKGLRNLKILCLRNIELCNPESFENVISNLPVLENLSIYDLNTSALKINAPNLRHFYFFGYFEDICFVDAPQLIDVYIKVIEFLDTDSTSNLSNALDWLIGIKKFAMLGSFVECLARFDLPRCFQLPAPYHRLDSLSMEVNLKDLNQILLTVGMLRSSPNIQELEIYSKYARDADHLVEDYWKAHGQLDCSMNHLNMVKIIGISGAQSELEFIKFLLVNSPLLEVLSLTPRHEDTNKLMILNSLLRFQCASANAEIGFKGFPRFRGQVLLIYPTLQLHQIGSLHSSVASMSANLDELLHFLKDNRKSDDIWPAILEVEGWDDETRYMTIDFLPTRPLRSMFISMTPEQRKEWVACKLVSRSQAPMSDPARSHLQNEIEDEHEEDFITEFIVDLIPVLLHLVIVLGHLPNSTRVNRNPQSP